MWLLITRIKCLGFFYKSVEEKFLNEFFENLENENEDFSEDEELSESTTQNLVRFYC